MRNPLIDKSYVRPASGKVYAGQLAPAGGATSPGGSVDIMTILPEPGYLKSIHANALTSVTSPPGWYTESSGYNGPWSNWCGSVFAKDYSQHGAEVYHGGGHGGYDGNEFSIFDLTTQLWSRLNDNPPAIWTQNTSADWCDYEYPAGSGNFMMPASHTYSHPVYISAAAGGGVKGSWCLPFIVYGGGATEGAGRSGYQPHAVDLVTGQWTRLTDNTANPLNYVIGAYGGCFTDSTRKVIWGFAGSESSTVARIDLTATPKHVTTQNIAGGGSNVYAVPVYVPEIDHTVQVSIYGDGQKRITFNLYNLASGTPAVYVPTFAAPMATALGRTGLGVDYSPDTGKFYCYEGFGERVLYVATPPGPKGDTSQWATGTWTWSTETMLGEAPVSVMEVQPGAQGAQPFTKWKYYRSIKRFGFSGGGAIRPSPDGVARAGAFQLYCPLGT